MGVGEGFVVGLVAAAVSFLVMAAQAGKEVQERQLGGDGGQLMSAMGDIYLLLAEGRLRLTACRLCLGLRLWVWLSSSGLLGLRVLVRASCRSLVHRWGTCPWRKERHVGE